MWNSAENAFARSSSFREETEDEEALRWAALERLPTYKRARRGIFKNVIGDIKEIDVRDLQAQEQRLLLERLVDCVDNDPERFFQRMRSRFDAVGLHFPKIEVRFQDLTVETYVHVGSRALPTIPNFICNMTEALLRQLRMYRRKRSKLTILADISGIIKPSRLTLLLGPPSSGKTTLLLALAGRLGPGLQMSGNITYNGHSLKEFVPQRTSAYVSQQDRHVAEMTVRETLQFAGRCQGVGFKFDMLLELARREKNAGIKPDEDLDLFMKSLALGGQETNLVVEYIMKILGLDICGDTLVGDEMLKGISGGQKKRLTTGELLIGPARVLFMDEISTGLDSSTTYQIIRYLKHSTRALDGTTIVSLLQPAPETYELFDDVILLCEGQIVYQGPREAAVDFFKQMGFSCPERKNVADFLQEVSSHNGIYVSTIVGFSDGSPDTSNSCQQVTSKKDQEQYWSVPDRPYRYVPVGKFAEAFSLYREGRILSEQLNLPFDRRYNHPAALATVSYGAKRLELLKTNYQWQKLLMKRNSFIYVFKFVQLLLVALITMSVFFRTTMHHNTIDDGGLYLGALYFSMVIILFNGFTEVSMLVAKLPVLYKHRDLHFYPSWAYTLPSWFLSIPTSLIEAGCWVTVSYYASGYDPAFTRVSFKRLFCVLLDLQIFAAVLAFFLPAPDVYRSVSFDRILGPEYDNRIPVWWIWGFWISPLMYAQNSASVNEFLGHSWDKKAGNQTTYSLGEAVLKERSLYAENYWYWIGLGAMVGYTILFNILFTIFLAYLNPLGRQQAVVSKDELQEREKRRKGESVVIELREYLQRSASSGKHFKQRGMVLPFQPLSMAFSNINYYVDVPLAFVEEVMELVELTPLSGALVGLPGIDGLSTEQRKRLTIAVELVANPSIVFMDEPTSGLDARAAAIVMRTVRNIVNTGRTIVCTIHQPSIDIFESFDEQNLCYWRNPQYTAVRFFYTVIISLMLGSICWRFGAKRETQQDLFNAMGSMYSAILFIGITNGTAVQPVVSVERFVSYRERAAGMYSALSFAFAQVVIEFPYVFAQAIIYSSIFYSMASFLWTFDRFIWYLFFMYFTMLYFTFYGMMTTAVTPNHNVAAIIAAPFYMLWNLFSGFMIPHKRIPIWWRWYYWANPVAWSLYGLLTSQYGGDTHLVKLSDGNSMTIREVLKHVFGYRHDFLCVTAVMVAGFCIFFGVIFSFAIKSFNFQRR
ncbi:hypothetical protein JHK82_047283 [Glycine max]|nr:hypothetical protein JHK82_047283 [Glycine max]